MHTVLETYLKTQTDLSDEAISYIKSLAVPRTLRRNECLLNVGEICRHKIFIETGLLRTFSTSADGNEHILQFAPEHNWALDAESYDKEIPSKVSIGAVEPSQVLCWYKSDFNTLLVEVPQLKVFSDRIISRNMHYSRQRMLTMLSATPEEKYEDFVRTFPEYLSRLPLRMIAAYLGMSLKTLTRIRHIQLQR
ncbi:Crp/Fnr family transcriptional regulator [Mucilaginibacter lacusdianchii]|uniref:Crp/Fnr family transcriptional regulator n=1 Tax=Mucilaginibacter lacusdianchii TaxID=2684211 RepID=UPI00131E5669|nr:Crp/Fnr family transcriptional regulator [Mucilaginibacter sp. JXJ CY 39]